MKTPYDIYQLCAVPFMIFGFIYAVWGLVRGDCPFNSRGVYSDSAIGRVAAGVGIGVVWPLFVLIALIWCAKFALTRGKSGKAP